MPAALESKLFILESHGDDDVEWIEQATGIPSFFKEEVFPIFISESLQTHFPKRRRKYTLCV